MKQAGSEAVDASCYAKAVLDAPPSGIDQNENCGVHLERLLLPCEKVETPGCDAVATTGGGRSYLDGKARRQQ